MINNLYKIQNLKLTALGLITKDWNVFKIEELLENKFIISHLDGNHGELYPKNDEFTETGIPYISANNFINGFVDFNSCKFLSEERASKFRKGIAKDGDVLFAHNATVGPVAVLKTELDYVILSTTATYFRCNLEYLNNYYLKEYFSSDYFINQYTRVMGQSTRNQVPITTQRNFYVILPPLLEQRGIAKILGLMDGVINKNNELIAKKELRKKWLMQNLLTGKKRLKGFEGEWRVIHIKEVAEEVSIRNKSDKELTVLSCTKYDGLVPSLEYFGRKIFADDTSTYKIVPKNHFAYATNHIEEGSIGYQEKLDEALISPMYTVFKTDSSINDTFFYKLLKSHKCVSQYQARMEGSIDRRGGLRWDAFSIIKISIPSYKEQTAIAQVLQSADREIELLKAKGENLRAEKKGLMQVLLTGRKRVKD